MPFFVPAFQVPLVQNNSYVKEAYFGLTCSGFLQLITECFSGGFDRGHAGPYLVHSLSM